MKQSPKGRKAKPKPRKSSKPKLSDKEQSERFIEAARNVSNTLEEGFIAAFKRIVRRTK
jgi:hypothetical protein